MNPVMTQNKVQLGQLLVAQEAVTNEQITEALAEQQQSGHQKLLGEILIEKGYCSSAQVAAALAQSYSVPYAKVSPRICDPTVFEILPKEFLDTHNVLPLFKVHNTLTVAVSEPADLFLTDQIEQISGAKVQVVCSTTKDIQATIQAYSSTENVFIVEDIIESDQENDIEVVESRDHDVKHLQEAADQSSVIQLVNFILSEAVKCNASDLHIEPDDNYLRVRYRIDGKLFEKTHPPHQMHAAIVSRIRVMAGLDIAQRSEAQEGQVRVMVSDKPIDLHVSILPGNWGEKIAVRIMDPQTSLINLECLGFTIDNLTRFRDLTSSANGLLLIAGPNGSGKSTTLYATLDELKSKPINICTVESPIRCNIGGVNQFEVNTLIKGEYPLTLRNVLRQDPDVVMIDTIHDGDTASVATQAALSGELILSTVHTADALGAVARLVDLGVPSYFVSDALIGVLAQRLVRKVCAHCKEVYRPSVSVRRTLDQLNQSVDSFVRGTGCTQCRHTGFSGRIALHELFIPDEAMRERISERVKITDLRALAGHKDMSSLLTDGIDKVRAGIVSIEEVLQAVSGLTW